jgi:hypothetical protein
VRLGRADIVQQSRSGNAENRTNAAFDPVRDTQGAVSGGG